MVEVEEEHRLLKENLDFEVAPNNDPAIEKAIHKKKSF